jgi:hypothetical protein
MADIIHFAPRAELDANANLRDFIDVCRTRLTAFGANLPFDENVWDITDALDLKASNGRYRLSFCTFGSLDECARSSMREPFLSFAKAFLRYLHPLRPTKCISQRLVALRALETAISEDTSCITPTAVTGHTLNRAAQLIKERYSPAVAYRTGGQLEFLATFLAEHQLMAVPIRWRNPIGRPRDGAQIGKEFDERRWSKLPSPAALEALAKAFRLASEAPDVMVTSIAAILCSAPDRINEVLHLEVDCDVTMVVPSTGKTVFGRRCHQSKGADPMVKWAVTTMAGVVQEALNKLKSATAGARDVAKWYEHHPGQLYLPRQFEHLRQREFLTMRELARVLFVEPVQDGVSQRWCDAHSLKTKREKGHRFAAFADVESAIVGMLPRGFPVANVERGLKYSNALCLVLRNSMHLERATYRCAIDLLEYGDIHNRLGATSSSNTTSIFERFGFLEEDGSPIRIRSHQFRHYLNTLAQVGGLSQLDIAKWSGRVDVAQNKVYDHQSDRDIQALAKDLLGVAQPVLPMPPALAKATMIRRDHFGLLAVTGGHTTDFGYCSHDFAMLPCQIHSDCINCDEHLCIKGDQERETRLRLHREETRGLLAEARSARSEGDAGASRWVQHQEITLSRLDRICQMLDDPKIPIATVISLQGLVTASRLEEVAGQGCAMPSISTRHGRRPRTRLGKGGVNESVSKKAALPASVVQAAAQVQRKDQVSTRQGARRRSAGPDTARPSEDRPPLRLSSAARRQSES